jgi:hypothetical protein
MRIEFVYTNNNTGHTYHKQMDWPHPCIPRSGDQITLYEYISDGDEVEDIKSNKVKITQDELEYIENTNWVVDVVFWDGDIVSIYLGNL